MPPRRHTGRSPWRHTFAPAWRDPIGRLASSPAEVLFPFQKLEAYRVARELATRVHAAGIRDAELRDQATRASKSAFLNLCEGLPNRGVGMRRKYFTSAHNSLHEVVSAVDLARAIGAIGAEDAAAVQALAVRLRGLVWGLLKIGAALGAAGPGPAAGGIVETTRRRTATDKDKDKDRHKDTDGREGLETSTHLDWREMSLSGARLGPYEIADRVGAGGMGEVYRARDTRLRRDVAVKVLHGHVALDPKRIRRFEQEARAAGQLNHPGIVAVFDLGTHDGSPYVVTELLEGQTLRERLRAGALPPREAGERALEIARALTVAHERGIVHRDLKPENLFLTGDGRLKVLDFGVAKLTLREVEPDIDASASTLSLGTEAGAILGTAGYMAPEQVRAAEVDHRADLFAVGAILYEMLTGEAAFEGDSSVERMNAILKEEPRALATRPPGAATDALAQRLFDVAARCLRKLPADRFATAADLAQALTAALAEPEGLPPAPPRTRGRFPAGVRALGLLALALPVAGYLVGRATGPRPASQEAPAPSAPAASASAALPAGEAPVPRYRQLTFQSGSIASARFAPDGRTVIYGACWGAGRLELYAGRTEGATSRALEVQGDVFAVSSAGEIAASLGRRLLWWPDEGKLARVPLLGGAPRELVEDVEGADWAPDADTLFVARRAGDRFRLEHPSGKVLFETGGWISDVRVSPKGDHVAFLHHPLRGDDQGGVAVVDMDGKLAELSTGWMSTQGLAWSPSGDEVWFTAFAKDAPSALYAVDLAGKLRTVLRAPGRITLQDVARDGRALLTRDDTRAVLMALGDGDAAERDLSSLELSVAAAIAGDGKRVLISEQSATGRPAYDVYLRSVRDGAPVLLGEGLATALSPDGKWALALSFGEGARLTLLPTGVGPAKGLGPAGMSYYYGVFFPDGRDVLTLANEPGKRRRYWAIPVEGGEARPLTPEGELAEAHVSPDGDRFAAREEQGALWVYPAAGGDGKKVAELGTFDHLAGWAAGGRAVYVLRRGERPARVDKVDLATGRRSAWKSITPTDPAGFVEVSAFAATPDGRAYAYTYFRKLSTLYVVEGLR